MLLILVTWIVDHHLYSERLAQMFPAEIAAVKARKMKGSELADRCDAALSSTMLSAEGNAFAEHYYRGRFQYYDDYEQILATAGQSMYHPTETWKNYNRLKPRLDERYEVWRQTRWRP